jgi:bla regulator protein BlaR1
LFWFHPLVWWIGARLMDERERDCDEAVLTQGSQPGDYARGIVQVCEAYLASPLPCASGISGSDLKKRIREIMAWRGSVPVTLRGKVMLAAAGLAAVSIPFAIGIVRAQTLPPPPAYSYEVVSIHPSAPGQTRTGFGLGPGGGLRTINTSVINLLAFAYNVRDYQFVGAPGWASSEHFDVILTPDRPETAVGPDSSLKDAMASQSRNQQRLQAVLRDRFGLVVRTENRELPIYALVTAKGGPKLSIHPEGGSPAHFLGNGNGHIDANGAVMSMLTNHLSYDLGRPVIDETGLTGQYDFKLDWTPDLNPTISDAAEPSNTAATGPSIFTALTDQLGLRLQSTKGPVVVYVIEKIQPPSEN